jgi:hypothetical protein
LRAGYQFTVKLDDEVTDSPFTFRVILPVVAADGTEVTIVLLVAALTTAAAPLNVTTLFAAVESKPVPDMMTAVPTEPLTGRNSVMVGRTVKLFDEAAVMPSTFTEMLPVVAPDGTVVTIDVAVELSTVAVTPLNVTVLFAAVVSKIVPWIVTVSPTSPLVGEKPEMVGDRPLPHPGRATRPRRHPVVTARLIPDMIFIAIHSFA